jgi:hypothetical protein
MRPLKFMQRLAAQATRLHPATSAALLSPLKGSLRRRIKQTLGLRVTRVSDDLGQQSLDRDASERQLPGTAAN